MMDFISSKVWTGVRTGYVYKLDNKGLGYYVDQHVLKHAKMITSTDNHFITSKRPASSFTDKEDDFSRFNKKTHHDTALEEEEEEEKAPVQILDEISLKHLLLNFEKKINKNQQLRIKFMNDPEKFMTSEIELHDGIQELYAIAASPELYPLLVSLGAVKSTLGVLTHENTDISLAAVSFLQELTDPDTLLSGNDDDNTQVQVLLDAFIMEQGIELVIQNLGRLHEEEEEDFLGISQSLTIIENIIEVRPSLVEEICQRTAILSYLMTRLSLKTFDANKLHASEILTILIQSSTLNQTRLLDLLIDGAGGMEYLLKLVFHYRKLTPESPDEEECVENIFMALRSVLLTHNGREQFLMNEGFELMMKCLKEGACAATCALKTISFAIAESASACSRLVDIGGLKYVFPVFMGRNVIKNMTKKKALKQELEETALLIISEICGQCVIIASEDTPMNEILPRILVKFQEHDMEKLTRCIELFVKYDKHVRATENELVRLRQQLEAVGDDEALEAFDEDDFTYTKLLAGGLFSLQQASKIIAFACIFEPMAPGHLASGFANIGSDLHRVLEVLREAALRLADEDSTEGLLQRRIFLTYSAVLKAKLGEM
jgi:beta-catenin-like protein 1